MRTKNFYLCLLLLVLGAANVWADKYYQPWDYRNSEPARYSSLSVMVGEEFMIYNTAFDDDVDLTGFLYDNGTIVTLDKTKERDRFVYNEKFVYILEEYGTTDDGAYAIRSINVGTYVAADGTTGHATPQPIYIKDWETAGTDGWARAGVRCENEDFQGIDNGSITNAGCQVFLLSSSATHVANASNYWNGEKSSFKLSTDGFPFAFYKVHEVQSGAYLEDLHIFSRSDIYSAQVIWGYVKTADDITGATETSLLIDGDLATGAATSDYLQFDLGEAVSSIYLFLQRSSADGAVIPENVMVQASANGTDGWQDVTTLATNLGSNISFTSDKISLGASYQYIRVVNASGEALALSEAYILPTDKKMQDAIGYFSELAKADNLVYTRASAQQYTSLVEEYNTEYPEAKTLSGVPIPGNKYRIYADAYDINTNTYVNQEIYWTGVDANGDNILTMSVAGQGSYHNTAEDSDARKAYEWYCEKTSDGYLVFRNVANTGLYLANDGKVSDTAYKWSFSTVQTHHFGVPMWDGQGKYLAVANDGTDGDAGWVLDVSAAQDQTNSANYSYQTAGADTPDDASDDEYIVVEDGVCTDFVFIPVDVTSAEKKITFTANEIAKRNSVFMFDGVTYSLPYSRMFTGDEELDKVTFTLLCPEVHSYAGTYVNNGDEADDTGKVGSTDNIVYTFDYASIADGDVLDIRLQFLPFNTCNDGSKLYLIQSVNTANVIQQAPGMRKADIEIGGDNNDGPIQTAGAEVYYAKFENRNNRMSLVAASKDALATTFDATSLFYFQPTEDTETDEYYSVSIRSAMTPFMCASADKWTESGDTWYVQPNATASSLEGYAISLDVLNATNNPGNAWCVDNSDGDSITLGNVELDGAAWMFVEVSDAEAAEMLKTYINTTGADVIAKIETKKSEAGIDGTKADKYIGYVNDEIIAIAGADDVSVARLVQLSQKVHMLEHEIEYALKQLPDATNRNLIGEAGGYDYPHWYYIYNVRSKYAADGTTEQDEYYAKFVGKNVYMALEQVADADADGKKDFGLDNMFYFEGRKVTEPIDGEYDKVEGNELTIDEYLQVDVHNFVAGKDTTLVSKNNVVYTSSDFHPGGDGWEGEATIVDGLNLQYNDVWRIECEYDFSGDKFESFNTYGSCLLSSTSPGLTWYNNEFQVYLQDDREIVVKLNNGYDTHKWDGTVDYYTNIRIVITHSPTTTIFDIYNSKGDKWTVQFNQASLNTVTQLKTMLPGNGVKIKILAIEEVKAHNWKVQDTSAGNSETVDTAAEEDTWYVLPSSNTTYPGFSIVAKGADDDNLGWTNVSASNNEIFSDAGNADNSTWQFVRIEEFDDLVDELMEKYDASDCVIYNEELAALFRLIKKNGSYIKKATVDNPIVIDGVEKTDEDFFNEIYEVIKNYTGPMPDELKQPKPDKFYTIRPAYGDSDMRLVANEYNNVVQEEGLEEVVDGNTHRDSRVVWFFDGDVDANNYITRNDNLTLNSLHTQSNTKDFTATKYMLDDDDTAEKIVLSPVGGCIVRLNDGTNNLRHQAIGDSTLVGSTETMSYGYVSTTFERTGTDDASVTSTAFNEFGELLYEVVDDEVVSAEVSVTSNYAYRETAGSITAEILCPQINANSGSIDHGSDGIVLEFTYSNLPSTFTSFNSVGLDIHALNGSNGYQGSGETHNRMWTVKVEAGSDALTDFGTLTDIQITDALTDGKTHKIWNISKDGGVAITDNKLTVKITITANPDNVGCFFGLSNVILSAEGDTWYIEEMPDEDKQYIFHETGTTKTGLGSVMLGYSATVPAGITAYYPRTTQDYTDKHITFQSYKDGVPACTPAIIKSDNAAATTCRFYYKGSEVAEAGNKADAEADDIIIDGSLYQKYQLVSYYDDKFGADCNDCNVYMYLSSKSQPKLYWVYENYQLNDDGTYTNTGDNDNGGYINVNANRAFVVVGKNVAKSISSFSLRFDGGWTTDIDEIVDDYRHETVDEGVKGIFDLQGRRLSEITVPGMYIIDGEKVLVK